VQLPSNSGRKVTEAVIWRKTDWISAWSSVSVFSGGGSAADVGVTFSLSVALRDEDFFEGLEKIWT